MANLEFRDNKAGFRYEALEDGELVSQIDYTIDGDVMTFTHTGTPPQHRGRKLADRLTRWALDDVRASGLGWCRCARSPHRSSHFMRPTTTTSSCSGCTENGRALGPQSGRRGLSYR